MFSWKRYIENYNEYLDSTIEYPDEAEDDYSEFLNSEKTGAATPHLNKEKFENLQIPLPPLSQQKQIVAYLDSLSEKIRRLKKLQNQTAHEISLLRQSILDKAFKGELK